MLLRTIILLLIFAVSVPTQAQTQSLVGKTKEEVKGIIKQHHRKFAEDQSVVRKQFNYLKYVNGAQTITWIVYFTENDICYSTKKVCDYSEYDFVLMDLEDQATEVGDLLWEYSDDDGTYTLTLKEEDWYFTLRERRKEE